MLKILQKNGFIRSFEVVNKKIIVLLSFNTLNQGSLNEFRINSARIAVKKNVSHKNFLKSYKNLVWYR
jgi:ribosomal protein S8